MERIHKVRKHLREWGCDAILIDLPIDLFYLTGLTLSTGRFIVDETDSFLFVDGRYFEACKNKCPFPVYLAKGSGSESTFIKQYPFAGKKIGFDSVTTSFHSYKELEASLQQETTLIPLLSPINQVRKIKDKQEIMQLKEAAKLADAGCEYLKEILHEGMVEKEAALLLELFWKKRGGEKVAFDPIIAFGEGSCQPHYRAGQQALKKGDLILIDIGVMKNHYASDLTRVFSFGPPEDLFKTIYSVVYKASQEALNLCHPGELISELDRAARSYITQAGYGEAFPHSLGHGVGLEVHEMPTIKSLGSSSKERLQEGMVITIEPGIYLPGKGGVRLENTIVITSTGWEVLTRTPLPEEIPLL